MRIAKTVHQAHEHQHDGDGIQAVSYTHLDHDHGEHEEDHERRDDVADVYGVVAALDLGGEAGQLVGTLARCIDQETVGQGLNALGDTGELLEHVRDGPADLGAYLCLLYTSM